MKYRIATTGLLLYMTAIGAVLSSALATASSDAVTRPVPTLPNTLIEAYGFGDGSSGPCPCNNESLPGMEQGCANSTGDGATLVGEGSTSIAADDLILRVRNLPPGSLAMLAVGMDLSDAAPFGSGLRVINAGRRLQVKTSSSLGLLNWRALSAQGGWMAGETRFFQVFYRDLHRTDGGSCSTVSNASNGLKVGFLP